MINLRWFPLIALGAMGLALSVALIDPNSTLAQAPVSWAAAIEAGEDHISPADLAARLIADPKSVLLVDVRPAEDFAGFHLPDAHSLSLPELLGTAGSELLTANPGRMVVLCSQGMTHPAQAWVELARRGERDVRVLEDGLDGFVRDVLTPPSLRGVVGNERAAAELMQFQLAAERFLAKGPSRNKVTIAPALAAAGFVAPPRKPSRLPASARLASSDDGSAKGSPYFVTSPKVDGTQAGAVAAPAPVKAAPALSARLASDPKTLTQPTIVSTAWVARRGSQIVLIDAREKPEAFAAAHLPGARHVPATAWREERNGVADELLPREALALAVGALGIDADTEVVAYADEKLQDPALIALALISLGHVKIAILEGGFTAWKSEGRALSTEIAPAPTRVYVPAKEVSVKTADLAAVIQASEGKRPALLDVRPADAFRGEVVTEARGGHIPGSLNRPYTSDVVKTAEGLYWRPVEDLRKEYEALGLRPKDALIVSCRTGHQAAQTYFTLRYLLGYEDVRWYDGSWKEWAAKTELPVATGEATR